MIKKIARKFAYSIVTKAARNPLELIALYALISLVSYFILANMFYSDARLSMQETIPVKIPNFRVFVSPKADETFPLHEETILARQKATITVMDVNYKPAEPPSPFLLLKQVTISAPKLSSSEGILNKSSLKAILAFHKYIEHEILLDKERKRFANICFKPKGQRCFVVSPLAFWNYDEQTINADIDLFKTASSIITDDEFMQGLPNTAFFRGNVLATDDSLLGASSAILTFVFLIEPDQYHLIQEWERKVRDASKQFFTSDFDFLRSIVFGNMKDVFRVFHSLIIHNLFIINSLAYKRDIGLM